MHSGKLVWIKKSAMLFKRRTRYKTMHMLLLQLMLLSFCFLFPGLTWCHIHFPPFFLRGKKLGLFSKWCNSNWRLCSTITTYSTACFLVVWNAHIYHNMAEIYTSSDTWWWCTKKTAEKKKWEARNSIRLTWLTWYEQSLHDALFLFLSDIGLHFFFKVAIND